jgi:hypothetical protein
MWNINANILLADILSTAATSVVIEAVHEKFPTPPELILATALIDGAISLSLFATFHLYANRHRGLRDLAQVQVHRWILGPLNYAVGSGIQYGLLRLNVRPSIGVLVAYWTALAVARTVHILYGRQTKLFE